MGCCISLEEPRKPETEEDAPYPDNGKKLRGDATFEEVYELGCTIGFGGYSKVKLVKNQDDGSKWACKIIPLPRAGHFYNDHMCSRSAIMTEIDVLLDLEHPNVVRLKEYFVFHNRVYLIMELLRGGELLDAVVERGHYSEEDARTVFVQLIRGVQYLHSMGVVHRDLKLDNLLLEHPGDITSIKIADFGFAKKHRNADSMLYEPMKTVCGTPEYMAPEIVRASRKLSSSSKTRGSGYGPACDLWACGVILYMLLSGSPPFSDDRQPRLFRLILAGRVDFSAPVWRSVSAEAKDLICRLLVVDPGGRATCEQVQAHAWMSMAGAGSTRVQALPEQTQAALLKQRRSSRIGRPSVDFRVARAAAASADETGGADGGGTVEQPTPASDLKAAAAAATAEGMPMPQNGVQSVHAALAASS